MGIYQHAFGGTLFDVTHLLCLDLVMNEISPPLGSLETDMAKSQCGSQQYWIEEKDNCNLGE